MVALLWRGPISIWKTNNLKDTSYLIHLEQEITNMPHQSFPSKSLQSLLFKIYSRVIPVECPYNIFHSSTRERALPFIEWEERRGAPRVCATSPKELCHMERELQERAATSHRGTQERAHLSWVRGATSHSSRLRLKGLVPPLTLQGLALREGSHLENCAQVREANSSILETSPNKLGWEPKCPLSWVLTQQNQKRTNCLFQFTENMFPHVPQN